MDYNMKMIFVMMFLCVLGAECVINQPIQDAQRREAPFNDQLSPPQNSPHKEYGVPVLRFGPPKVNVEHGPPNQRPQQQQQQQQQQRPQLNQRQQQMLQALQGQRQNRFQQLQRIMGALRSGSGVSSQGRVVNRPRPQPIPISPPQQQHQHQQQQQQQGSYNPQQNYGPPQQNNQGPPKIQYGAPSSSSGSLANFVQNHNPDVKCDGWIPIFPASGNGNSIDGGYQSNGNAQHSHGESHGSANAGYQSQGQSHHSHGESHGHSGGAGYQSQGQAHHSHGESHGHSGNAGYQSQGQSHHSHGESHGHHESHHSNGGSADNVNIIESYGLPNHGSGPNLPSAHQLQQFPNFKNGGSAGGINLPENSYGPPDHSHGGSAGGINLPENSYGPPDHSHGGSAGGINLPENSYGPPDHSHGGSAGGINLPEESYGPPNHNNAGAGGIITLPDNSYGPPDHSHSHGEGSLSNANIVVEQSVDFGPPESSYGPPPSGSAHLESHNENHGSSHSESHGHAGGIQSIQSIGVELQLPQVNSGSHFSNDLGLISSAISSGQSELVQSHAVHESHTSELTNNFIGGGTASSYQQIEHNNAGHNNAGHSNAGQFQQTGGLGSYATVESGVSSSFGSTGGDSYSTPPLDSYAPGKYNPSFLNKRPAQAQQLPQQPPKLFLPQRPSLLPPSPQYIPPIPIKILRPRPQQFQGQAHSIAQGYAANAGSQQNQQQSHSIGHGFASNSGSQQQSHSSSQGYASNSGSQQAHSHQSIGGHSQHIQHGPSAPQQQIRQQPRHPLTYRTPVPQGLLESIGQQVQALDNGHQIQQLGSSYLPPPTSDLPFSNQGPQQFHSNNQQQGSSGSGYSTQSQSQSHQQSSHNQQSGSGAYAYQNEVRNYPTHDCGKGPQFNQVQVPHQEYGPPPTENVNYRHTNVVSESLEIPSHNSADFNSASSYGPPASGPALLDNVGYESQVRSNIGGSTSETQIIESTGSESHSSSHQQNEQLPGLNTGLSGLDFISAQKSQSLQIPVQGALGSYELQFQSSGGNSVDGPNHQQILSDGLLNSILSAIEQPNQQIPQVTEDQQTDHSEVQVFLKSPAGQNVIADKVPEAAANESEEPAVDITTT